MVDLDLIRRKGAELAERLDHLREMAAIPVERFLAEHTARSATRYDLIVAIECCIDAGQHIHADEGWKTPGNYAAVFRGLATRGVISSDLAADLADAAELRNRAVHLDDVIDDRIIHENLPAQIGALASFAEAVAPWIKDR